MNDHYSIKTYNPIYKVAHCKHCNKIEELSIAEIEWFIVNISVAYCSETCWLLERDNEDT